MDDEKRRTPQIKSDWCSILFLIRQRNFLIASSIDAWLHVLSSAVRVSARNGITSDQPSLQTYERLIFIYDFAFRNET